LVSERSALSAVELKADLVDLFSEMGSFSDLDWHAELEGGVLSDREIDWNENFLDVRGGFLLDLALESGALLPLP